MGHNKLKRNLLLMIIVSLFFLSDVQAKTIDLTGGGESSGQNSACAAINGYVACYKPKFQFRVTLVDKTGKKVTGTRSIDFTHSNDKQTYIHTSNLESASISDVDSNVSFINGGYYYYKYSSKYNDKNGKYYKYISVDMVNNINAYKAVTGNDDPNKYTQFWNEFYGNVKNRKNNIDVPGDSTTKVDFLSLVLYLNGYLDYENDYTKIIDIDSTITPENEQKLKNISNNDYYLLIEPTYVIYYNETPGGSHKYKYGTATEIASWMYNEINKNNDTRKKYNNGYLAGLSANFIYNIGCNLHETQNLVDSIEYEAITTGANCGVGGGLGDLASYPYPTRAERLSFMSNISDYSNGYGISVTKISSMIDMPKTETNKCVFSINRCTKNDGEISSTFLGEKNVCIIDVEEFKVADNIYCYDSNVTYDFKDTFATIGKDLNILSEITIPKGKLIVNRSCYFKEINQASTPNIEDVKDINKNSLSGGYKNDIIINFLNAKLKMSLDGNSIEVLSEEWQYINRTKNRGWLHLTISADYVHEYTNDLENSSLYRNLDSYIAKNVADDYRNNIDFSNNDKIKVENLFGFNNKALKNIKNNSLTSITKTTSTSLNFDVETSKTTKQDYSINYSDIDNINNITDINSPEYLKCSNSNKINEETNPLEDLKFRVISLSNPFPARDGTSRLPGTNWLNDNNYVYEYIINNRNIQNVHLKGMVGNISGYNSAEYENKVNPEMMYLTLEPIYTITLTPSTMVEIRKYNQSHTYDDIILDCEDDRKCTSQFLATLTEDGKITGSCSTYENEPDTKRSFNTVKFDEYTKKCKDGKTDCPYKAEYDLNNDKKVNIYDIVARDDKQRKGEISCKQTTCTYSIKGDAKKINYYSCADKTEESGG